MPNTATLNPALLVWTDSTRYMYLTYETRLLACLRAVLRHPYIDGPRIRILLTILSLNICHCSLIYFNRARNLILHSSASSLPPPAASRYLRAPLWCVSVLVSRSSTQHGRLPTCSLREVGVRQHRIESGVVVGWYTRTLKTRPSPTSSRANYIAPRSPGHRTALLLHTRCCRSAR
jgi:hypothetical protein